MAVLGFVVHHARARAEELARDAVPWLTERGHEARVLLPEAEESGLGHVGCEEDAFVKDLDLAVSLGGDGTMLRTVGLVAPHGVPVLGVNVGRLGYLSQVEPAGLLDALERFLAGDYDTERRMSMAVTVESSGTAASAHCGLNEAVVEKMSSGHTIHVAVAINDRFFTSYAADAMIVATPTGSTAYALSARGPIMSPVHRAMLLTPVAPHMLFDRSLVLDEREDVRLEVIDDRPVRLTIDGREAGELHKGDSIVCRAAPYDALLVTFGERNFYGILKSKFGLADR